MASGSTNNFTSPMISWWYSCDQNWTLAVDQISNHLGNSTSPSLVTSIQTYCGNLVDDSGKIYGETSTDCQSFFKAITALGVKSELVLGQTNCSIDGMRLLWADKTTSPKQLLALAQEAGASGWNIDFEPQTEDCSGSPSGDSEDAILYAEWLQAVWNILNPAGIRLTIDVASWSPVLVEFATLAPAVDRLQNMETYNGGDKKTWLSYYNEFVNDIPLNKAGVGIGVWSDGEGSWWETPEGADEKISVCKKGQVPELAMFRIATSSQVGNPPWPLPFWWPALQTFLK